MSRWTQTWLSGASGATGDPGERDGAYRGARLRLPEHGPGSVASFSRRGVAILVDWLPCSVAAQLLTNNPAFSALAIFAALTAASIALFGRTPGHALVGLRVAHLDEHGAGRDAGFGAAVIRTVLLCLLIPPLVYDLDGRGLHDKAAGTIVLRTR